jgi:NADH dehydrogenase
VGKVEAERILTESSMSYAILRPTVFFGGKRDVLINNMAWLIRKFPVFGIFGFGRYPIQPIHIQDVARVAVDQGESMEDVVLDVAGPEIFTYREYVTLISRSIGKRRLIVPVPPIFGWFVGKLVGVVLRDRVITRAEIKGLMRGLMATDAEPVGKIKFSEWVATNGASLGAKYQNDLKERKYSDPGSGFTQRLS